jgi:plastocyanin domain-containing protein
MNQPGVVVKDGVQTATIIVNEAGYAPQKLELQPNMPTKIKFYADETASCSRQILSKQLDFIELVDVNEAKIIDVGKLEPGTYKYRCGMDMHKGEIVVTE